MYIISIDVHLSVLVPYESSAKTWISEVITYQQRYVIVTAWLLRE